MKIKILYLCVPKQDHQSTHIFWQLFLQIMYVHWFFLQIKEKLQNFLYFQE